MLGRDQVIYDYHRNVIEGLTLAGSRLAAHQKDKTAENLYLRILTYIGNAPILCDHAEVGSLIEKTKTTADRIVVVSPQTAPVAELIQQEVAVMIAEMYNDEPPTPAAQRIQELRKG